MSQDFNPDKYWFYNTQTEVDEPQFKEWEDLPEKYRSEFKKAPNGGYVRTEAVEDVIQAQFMAKSENIVRKNQEHRLNQQIRKIDEDANRESEIIAETFTAGRAERAKKVR
jgi:hypothetical protein